MSRVFDNMADLLPVGRKGDAILEHFEVSEADAKFTRMREVVTGGRERSLLPGRYAKLLVGGQLMMTDTRMEQETNLQLIRRARGDVFIAGLGLGMVLVPLLKKPEVNTVLVVEKSQDVIDLVSPHLLNMDVEKLFIFQGDIFTWNPDPSWLFDVVYFDIWPTITGDNYEEIKKLHARYRPHLKTGGWMASWVEEQVKDLHFGRAYGRGLRCGFRT